MATKRSPSKAAPTSWPAASHPPDGYLSASIAPPRFAEADAAVRAELGRRYSAAVLRIDVGGRLRFCRAYGATAHGGGMPVYPDTRFDLASLTKLFVSTVALGYVAEHRLDLDLPLGPLMPQWEGTPHAGVTLRMLLAHTAGFRSGADYRTLLDRNVEDFALTQPLIAAPGTQVVYSDLGFIALGILAERSGGANLAYCVRRALAAGGLTGAGYRVAPPERAAIPATERDAWRGVVQGVVHDEKAYLMNGVAGHAGVFGSAAHVALLAGWYLAAVRGRRTPLDPGLARLAVREAAFDPVLRRGLGWALRTTATNSCGAAMSAETFGHTGFTGTSVWVDPGRDLVVVLLTNAVHYGRTDIRSIRAAVCDAAVAAVDA